MSARKRIPVETPKVRTLEQINVEYTTECGLFGHKTRLLKQFEKEAIAHMHKMTALVVEGASLPVQAPSQETL